MVKYISSGTPGYRTVHFKWHVNTRCQYRCDYCYFMKFLNKNEPIKNKNAYVDVIKRLSLKSIPKFKIDLLGGEPTLHENINTIIKSLCTIDSCESVDIHTNMVREANWYKQLDKAEYSKLSINGSYHPQYIKSNHKFIKRCSSVSKSNNIKFICNINIYEDMWCQIKNVITGLLDEGVLTGLQMLNDVGNNWHANYSDNFKLEFNNFIDKIECEYKTSLFTKQKVTFVDDRGDTLVTDDYNTRLNQMDIFTGWSCRTVLWDIKPNGVISNGCTGELLSINNKNIHSMVNCPVTTGCPCADCYIFEKHEKLH